MKNFIYIFILIIFTYSFHLKSSENKIIFKINDNAFTSLDLERRIEYLDFVGSNNNLEKKIIIDDFISANLFYEHFKNLKIENKYETKIKEIYDEIYAVNKKNGKKYDYEIKNENILNNIKIDYIRKIILENIFNTNKNNLNTSNEEIDLLYNITIRYINLKTNEFNKIINNIPDFETLDYESLLFFLKKNNLDYFTKEKEIINMNKIDYRIRENISSNNHFFIIEKSQIKSLIFIEKKFETLDGIVVDLYSIKSEDELDKNFLKCKNLINLNKNQNILNKEYKLVNLNDDLKENLININDYVKFLSNNQNIYVVLCNIKFDKEILNNNNFNKMINLNISEIENKFINKYSKIYNLIRLSE